MFSKNKLNPSVPESKPVGKTFTNRYGSVMCQVKQKPRNKMKDIVKEMHNVNVVEIGVLGGATLLDLYDICKKNNNKLFGIDPFETITVFGGYNENELKKETVDGYREVNKNNRINLEKIINKHNLNNLKLVIGCSQDHINDFENESIGFLHIDGTHSYEGFKADLEGYFSKIIKGGVIAIDDYQWKGIKKATNKFMKENKDKVIFHSLHKLNSSRCLLKKV